jgi:hypothetical protein
VNAIKVKKSELLTRLRPARITHCAIRGYCAVGYRQKLIEALEARIAEVRSGKTPNLAFNLPLPVDQTKAYDRAIGMLELSVDDVIELEEHDYQQYVLDEWAWSASASASNSFYTSAR